MRDFWTGIATAVTIVVMAGGLALATETVHCKTLGPNGEVHLLLCAAGHLDLPRLMK